MARRFISGRQKYVMWLIWESGASSIKDLASQFNLSKNKVKRILRKYRKAHDDREYSKECSKTIAFYAKKHNVSLERRIGL